MRRRSVCGTSTTMGVGRRGILTCRSCNLRSVVIDARISAAVLLFYPPAIEHALTWRRMYTDGAFAQRELIGSGTFNSRAKNRGTTLSIGDDTLIYLHKVGALRPVAFSRGPYWSGTQVPAESADQMVFSDEDPSSSWSDYEYELHGHAEVTALYTYWQQLAVIDAVDAGKLTVPLWVVASDADMGVSALNQMRAWAQRQDERWRGLDSAWRPLLLTLVRLQNRYLPELTHRTTLLFDVESGMRVDPFVAERETFDLKAVFERDFCEDRNGLLAAYHFLVDRGLRHDPQDGLTMLRRARPRAFHIRWRGEPRRAQDHFDAADILRRFLADVDGRQPPQAKAIPMDGRQDERAELFERGPGAPWNGSAVVAALQKADLYPHGVHVVHEGDSERLVIEVLVVSLLGSSALEEINFTDLQGAGNTGVIADLVGSLDGYARRVVVILDNEAKARDHVEALIASGEISADDVLLFNTSFEEANAANDDELAAIATNLAAERGVSIEIDGQALRGFHDERIRRSRDRGTEAPGLATSLQHVVSKASSGSWHLRKRDLVQRLAIIIAEEMHDIPSEDWKRPIASFVLERIVPPLNRSIPLGAQD